MTTRTRIDFLPAIASRSDPLVEFTAATCPYSPLTHEVRQRQTPDLQLHQTATTEVCHLISRHVSRATSGVGSKPANS